MSIRVAIVEDHELTRENLARLVRQTSGFECVGMFPTAEHALETLPGTEVDVVLMDINLPKMSGVGCARRLKARMPDVQIVMLTVSENTSAVAWIVSPLLAASTAS